MSVHRFNLTGGLVLSPCVRWTGLLIVILALRPLLLVFGIYVAGLFEDPKTPVSMIGWFIRDAMDLTWTIEYVLQARWALIISFIWLLPLTGLGATESGIYCSVIGVVTITWRLCLLRRSLPLLFLTSEVPISLSMLLLRAS